MGITNSNKSLSASNIECGGSFQVRLSLTAAPDIVSNPTDIVLILDRSGSMRGSPLENLKVGAKTFIDIIDEATDGAQDGQIGSGSRIGIVSFADTAVQDTQLITSVAALKSAVDALSAGGDTNHADAFTKALGLFDPASTNAKVMVMFTDGETTAGPDPSPVASAARTQGVVIYSIGLSGSGGLNQQALEDWSSKPSASYVVITPNEGELEEVFEDLARNISKPGATNVDIVDEIHPCFRITSISSPTKGTASMLGSNTVRWRIDQLGVTQSEGAVLQFTVEHVGPCAGTLEVNEEIAYSDNEGNVVSFPSPEIEVECDIVVQPEVCPAAIDVVMDGCSDALEFDAGDLALESMGRILQLDVTLRNVCPNRRVALAILVNEVDENGQEYKRGMKTMTIPAHTRAACQDVLVRCVKFVLPESLAVPGPANSICGERAFRCRMIANYIDHDFNCCALLS